MRFRKQFDEDAAERASEATALDCSGDPGITSQSDAVDADINNIVRKYHISDEMTPAQVQQLLGTAEPGAYGDFSLGMTYHEAMTQLKRAEATFMAIPAAMRSKFGNSPAELLDSLRLAESGDKKALDRLVAAGVVKAPPVAQAAVPAPAGAADGVSPPEGGGKPPSGGAAV